MIDLSCDGDTESGDRNRSGGFQRGGQLQGLFRNRLKGIAMRQLHDCQLLAGGVAEYAAQQCFMADVHTDCTETLRDGFEHDRRFAAVGSAATGFAQYSLPNQPVHQPRNSGTAQMHRLCQIGP